MSAYMPDSANHDFAARGRPLRGTPTPAALPTWMRTVASTAVAPGTYDLHVDSRLGELHAKVRVR